MHFFIRAWGLLAYDEDLPFVLWWMETPTELGFSLEGRIDWFGVATNYVQVFHTFQECLNGAGMLVVGGECKGAAMKARVSQKDSTVVWSESQKIITRKTSVWHNLIFSINCLICRQCRDYIQYRGRNWRQKNYLEAVSARLVKRDYVLN